MGRPKKQDQLKIRSELMGYFERGCNVFYTSKKSEHNRKTVTRYFEEFGEQAVEEMNEKFVVRQKIAKETAVMGLQEDMDLIDKELKDIELHKLGVADESPTWRSQYHNLIKMRSDIRQYKCDIECMPTIDVSIDQMLEERENEKIKRITNKQTK